jgi:hypothetical protein
MKSKMFHFTKYLSYRSNFLNPRSPSSERGTSKQALVGSGKDDAWLQGRGPMVVFHFGIFLSIACVLGSTVLGGSNVHLIVLITAFGRR